MNRDEMLRAVAKELRGHITLRRQMPDVYVAATAIVDLLRPRDRKVVVSIESPYRPPKEEIGTGQWLETLRRNTLYARALYRFALHEGYAPFASHLNYTQPGVLDDETMDERWWGIHAGKAIERAAAEESWFGIDFGTSEGMEYGLKDAKENGRPTRNIVLGSDWESKWLGPTRNRPI